MTDHVTVFEMGPRDGLQNEKRPIATADKITLVDLLSASGFAKIEVTSFVSPKWVPQMADAADVMAGISRRENIRYTVLTPNLRGLEGALAAKADEVAVFAAASEGFSQKNINCSIAQSIDRFKAVLDGAKAHGVPVRGYVSCVTHCPYDGPAPPAKVADVTERLLKAGCYEVSLGDTIGAGTPETIGAMLDAVLAIAPADRLAGHYHDTGGRACDNVLVSLDKGLRTFDSAVSGLGGCPYAPGAKGNVATESVVNTLHGQGLHTGLAMDALAKASAFARTLRSDT